MDGLLLFICEEDGWNSLLQSQNIKRERYWYRIIKSTRQAPGQRPPFVQWICWADMRSDRCAMITRSTIIVIKYSVIYIILTITVTGWVHRKLHWNGLHLQLLGLLRYLRLVNRFTHVITRSYSIKSSFSHHRVTIPPPGWTTAAHRQGVKMLGTLLVYLYFLIRS
jgi:hypothetical protein